MCGIAGFTKKHPDERKLDEMLSMLVHRGPDELGTYVDDQAAIGATRLSIIDIPDGQQPIRDDATGTVIAMNGEIFNYVELRERLESQGHRFETQSDTEVVLRLYLQEGERFPTWLNGQFAISIWDRNAAKLILTRDRFGICPLFYCESGNAFFFASELKALLAHPAVPRQLNPMALDQIFTFWTTVPGHTPLQSVYELQPGELLTKQFNDRAHLSRYWEWPFPTQQETRQIDFEESKELFVEQLLQSIRLRLRADVEIGSYLSGGVDSSAIVALATRIASTPFRTYSIGFEDASYDETPFQTAVADAYETDHRPVVCRSEDIAENFESVLWHTEMPLFRTAPSPLNRLSSAVRNTSQKVVLTGEGADEILLGYDIFREVKIRRFWSRQPDSKARPELLKKLYAYLPQFANRRFANLAIQSFRGSLHSDSPFYSHLIRWENNAANKVYFSGELRTSLADSDATTSLTETLPEEFFSVDDVDRAQYLELVTLLRGYLLSSQGDRMLMSNSVEGRFPFLDHEFVAFANSLPRSHKLRGLQDKRILREAMRDLLPQQICHRPKFAYQAPEIRAFITEKGATSDLVEQYLTPNAIRETGLFDESRVELLVKKARAVELPRLGTRDNMAFVQVLSTQCFHRQFIATDIPARAAQQANNLKIKTRLYGHREKAM